MPSLDILDKFIIDRRRSLPLHAQLQQALRKTISDDFADGDTFFTETDIQNRFGVSRATVRQALGEISREGLLLRRRSIGTIVKKTPTPAVTFPTSAPEETSRASGPVTASVGVFIEDYHSEYRSMMLQAIMEEGRRCGLPVQMYYTHMGEDLRSAYQQIKSSPADERSILMTHSRELREALTESGYRTVSFESSALNDDGDIVETDAAMAVRSGVEYLRANGHERITLLVNEPADRVSVQQKVEQFHRSVPQGRVIVCETQEWDNSYQAAYSHMTALWRTDAAGLPTAIMTASDPGAWAAMRWLSEQGISVPGDVSVLGFEDARSSRFMHPALSTIAHPYAELARIALEMLQQEVHGPRRLRVAPSLVIRESTGPAPQ